MKIMRNQLIELLNIHAISGNEAPVRSYIKREVEPLVDIMETDWYGNLLLTKRYGSGKGATILLSAHMDTVDEVLADRRLIEIGNFIASSEGALGADDRAGIAIILAVLRTLEENAAFQGIIKIAFTREEEVGGFGARHIDRAFYADCDLAIVVDRRGTRDIVVGGVEAYCSNEVGDFMMKMGKAVGQPDWMCVKGGFSDTHTFSQQGIQAVNLSAGYFNEHQPTEMVSIQAMYETAKLILHTLPNVEHACGTFGAVPKNNRWVTDWYNQKYSKFFDPSISSAT